MPIADRMGGQSLDFNNDELHRTNVINLQLSTVTEFDQNSSLVVTPVSTSTYGEQMLSHMYTHTTVVHKCTDTCTYVNIE
jgi:hypothetical protein